MLKLNEYKKIYIYIVPIQYDEDKFVVKIIKKKFQMIKSINNNKLD